MFRRSGPVHMLLQSNSHEHLPQDALPGHCSVISWNESSSITGLRWKADDGALTRLPFVGFAQGRVSIMLHFFCILMIECCDHRAIVNNRKSSNLMFNEMDGWKTRRSVLPLWPSMVFPLPVSADELEHWASTLSGFIASHNSLLYGCWLLIHQLMKQLLAEHSLCISVAKLSLYQMKK